MAVPVQVAQEPQRDAGGDRHLEEGRGVSKSVEHHCTASLGLAVFSPADSNGDNILKRADNAMYQAKAKGRNQISFGEE